MSPYNKADREAFTTGLIETSFFCPKIQVTVCHSLSVVKKCHYIPSRTIFTSLCNKRLSVKNFAWLKDTHVWDFYR